MCIRDRYWLDRRGRDGGVGLVPPDQGLAGSAGRRCADLLRLIPGARTKRPAHAGLFLSVQYHVQRDQQHGAAEYHRLDAQRPRRIEASQDDLAAVDPREMAEQEMCIRDRGWKALLMSLLP